jgi:hypothetical protein
VSTRVEQLYLDEVARSLTCASRTCHGPVRIALIYDGKTEGFVGGMALTITSPSNLEPLAASLVVVR